MKKIPKRSVRQNIWGNWRGYESGKFVKEFPADVAFLVSGPEIGTVGTDMPIEAAEWLNHIGATHPTERIKFSRIWAMPNSDTFDVPPIGQMVKRFLRQSTVSCDPFARNKRWTTHTNDLNPKTESEYHMDAEQFLIMLADKSVKCDLAIFDPPYSPRQISECYKEAGITCGMKETQNAALYARIKAALIPVLTQNAIVLSFGWNSAGMGKKHGFEIIEILLCCHGAAHNDTICMAERRIQGQLI